MAVHDYLASDLAGLGITLVTIFCSPADDDVEAAQQRVAAEASKYLKFTFQG